ncbi:MAG TPA: GDP-mannose 4,6-dehydratase, partial [Thermoanaerobaculia bacterium]|nr:GDP-mannose 4,6-dehydratase [Thermoanaerobaculia bacterium]
MILVTGAAGFIGYHVARRLLERGDEVVGIDSMNDYYDVALKHARLEQLLPFPKFRFLQLDLSDGLAVSGAFIEHRPSRVVHLAAQPGVRYSLTHPHKYTASNIEAFLNIL